MRRYCLVWILPSRLTSLIYLRLLFFLYLVTKQTLPAADVPEKIDANSRQIFRETGTCREVCSKQNRRSRRRLNCQSTLSHWGRGGTSHTLTCARIQRPQSVGRCRCFPDTAGGNAELREVARKNLNKLMRKNGWSGIEISLVVFRSLHNDFRDVIQQSDKC